MFQATNFGVVPLYTPLCRAHFFEHVLDHFQRATYANEVNVPLVNKISIEPTRVQPRRAVKSKYLDSMATAQADRRHLPGAGEVEDLFLEKEVQALKQALDRENEYRDCPFGTKPWECLSCSENNLSKNGTATAPMASMAPTGKEVHLYSEDGWENLKLTSIKIGELKFVVDDCAGRKYMFV